MVVILLLLCVIIGPFLFALVYTLMALFRTARPGRDPLGELLGELLGLLDLVGFIFWFGILSLVAYAIAISF